MKILLKEHTCVEISRNSTPSFAAITQESVRLFKVERGKKIYPFLLQKKDENIFQLTADYYIGVDWLVEGRKYVQVEPKINTGLVSAFKEAASLLEPATIETEEKNQGISQFSDCGLVEVDYLSMLLNIMSAGLPEEHTNKLILVDWQMSQIPVSQQEDRLTPFLIVQFLQLLKRIVRKGLKKSYYRVRENLSNRVKGKILVSSHLRQNVFKNRVTQTYCEYQAFGDDNRENRFLKKVLCFAASYAENNKECFAGHIRTVEMLINYCRPAFEHISSKLNDDQLKQIRQSPLFKEYKEAIKIGTYILKKFAYNITQTSNQLRTTPPFWIDMPKLFELYCYIQLSKNNTADKNHIHYQFSTYGNVLDILVSKPCAQMVIDAKYKLHYRHSQVHQDIRQVAGYARLKKVRDQLKIADDQNIDCLILYPEIGASNVLDYSLSQLKTRMLDSPIAAYYKMYKLGIALPIIK